MRVPTSRGNLLFSICAAQNPAFILRSWHHMGGSCLQLPTLGRGCLTCCFCHAQMLPAPVEEAIHSVHYCLRI